MVEPFELIPISRLTFQSPQNGHKLTGGKMNNKIKALAVGGAIVVLSAAGMHAIAQERGHGRLAHRVQFQHPVMGGEAPWISIALRHKAELNLSADQVANLEKIRSAFQNQVTPVAQQLKAVEGELRTTLQESPANLVLARTKIDQAEKLRADLRYLRVESRWKTAKQF